MATTPQSLDLADRANGVGVRLNAATGEMTLTYAPADGAYEFFATSRAQQPDLREKLSTLCAGNAMPDAVRPVSMTHRLRQLPARAVWPAKIMGLRLRLVLEWLLASKENTNYTYDLTPLNQTYLASMIAVVTARPVAEIESYLKELAADSELAQHYADSIAALTPDLAAVADPIARWSRRVGWYALVRAKKPRVVVETGVDKGHGALVLCAALRRNAAEGHPGRYIGTDINPRAGYLLRPPYAAHGNVMIGDSIASLRTLTEPIDIFINDSDHSADYENAEYQTITSLLHAGSVIIGDNAHVTDKLARFAAHTGRRFLFFSEAPLDHWYGGAGIGFAFT